MGNRDLILALMLLYRGCEVWDWGRAVREEGEKESRPSGTTAMPGIVI